MYEEVTTHENLFSSASLKIGKIHWYILKADNEMENRCYIKGKDLLEEVNLTDFGKEVGSDEIHWWVFKKEAQIKELLNRTKRTLKSAQKLKEDSSLLKRGYRPQSYKEIISKIKEFTEFHDKEIDALLDYVIWLYKKDILAPSILFTYRVWGSTRLSDRFTKITATNIKEDPESVKRTTEIALGLLQRGKHTLHSVYMDILEEMVESADPEHQRFITVPKRRLILQTSQEVLNELSVYFELLRQSLRNIILEIERYNTQTELLYNETFWKSFIIKAMSAGRVETQLWDFKKTFEIWHLMHKDKDQAEVKFCEQIAAFANGKGGVIIVGITDSPPRTIVGISDLENKLKHTKLILKRHIEYDGEYIHFQQVILKDSENRDKSCLILAIAQTKDVVSVKDQLGRFSYPLRLETGLERVNNEKIRESKTNVLNDNYDFVSDLDRLVHDR